MILTKSRRQFSPYKYHFPSTAPIHAMEGAASASTTTNVLYHCRPCARTLPTRDLAKHLAGKPHLACQSAADHALVQPRIVVSGVSTKYGMWECVPCQRSMMRVTRASHLRGAPHAKMVAGVGGRKEVVQQEAERQKQKQMRDELEAIEQATRRREEVEADAQRELELERQRRMRDELEAIERATKRRQEAEREKQRKIQEERDRLEAIEVATRKRQEAERERESERERERLEELKRVQEERLQEIERVFRKKQEAEQEEQRQMQREMEARAAQLEREMKEGEEERAREKQARRDAAKQRKEVKRNMKERERALWMEAKQQREEEGYRYLDARQGQQEGDEIEQAAELRPLAGSTTPGGSVQSNGGDGLRSKMLEYLQSQGVLQQDGLDLAPVETLQKTVTEFERTGYVSRLVLHTLTNNASTIPMFVSNTDLPPVLYRVYDGTSVSKYSWLGFIAKIPYLPDDPLYFRSMVQRHGNWSCRQGTPFVSVTASPDAAGWHIAKKQTSELPTNIMVALVDTAALLRATRVWKMHDAMDHFGLQPSGCERRAYDNEYICAGGIPASAVFACCQPEYYMDMALVFMKNLERKEAEKTRAKGTVVTIRAPDEVVGEVSVEGGCLIPYGASDFAA